MHHSQYIKGRLAIHTGPYE